MVQLAVDGAGATSPGSGTATSTGGGGGAGHYGGLTAGDGGSGVVIIRSSTQAASAVTGTYALDNSRSIRISCVSI